MQAHIMFRKGTLSLEQVTSICLVTNICQKCSSHYEWVLGTNVRLQTLLLFGVNDDEWCFGLNNFQQLSLFRYMSNIDDSHDSVKHTPKKKVRLWCINRVNQSLWGCKGVHCPPWVMLQFFFTNLTFSSREIKEDTQWV